MGYKYSRYNVVLSGKKDYLWNTCSGYVAALDEKGKNYISSLRCGDPVPQDSPYFGIMKKSGFIVYDNLDESGRIMQKYRQALTGADSDTLSLTIAPGMNCNYRCEYCFEADNLRNISMSEDTAEAVAEFVESRLSMNLNHKKLHVVWFGGEPLLYMPILTALSRKLIDICDRLDLKYSSHIVTNARYLSRDIAQTLRDLRVRSAQISADGTESAYCAAKRASKEDFCAVIHNIESACDIINITVRININPEEYEEAQKLTHCLLTEKGLNGKIKIYLAFKRNYSCTAKKERSNFSQYCALDSRFRDLFKSGSYDPFSYQYKKVNRFSAPCTNVCDNSFCIGPEGELYQCEHHFGNKDKTVGDIKNGLYYNEKYSAYSSAVLPQDACLTCGFLPCCMGGCPDDRISDRFVIDCRAYTARLCELKLFEIEQKESAAQNN